MKRYKEVVEKQKEFFKTGKPIDINYRKKALIKLRDTVDKYEEKILYALKLDLGKSEFEGYETELGIVKSELKNTIKNLEKWSKPKKVRASIMNPFSDNRIYNQPYGVCLILSPWNYPFQLALMPLIGSIAAGNTSILKLSEISPFTSGVVREIVEEVFDEEYVAVFSGEAEEAINLIESDVDFIFYTGNPKIGVSVAESAGRRLIPCVLELGGKSPCIIDRKADLDNAAKKIVWGKFMNAGQTCVAPDYIIADRLVFLELRDKLVHYIKEFYGENPIESDDYPKIINKKNFDRILNLIEGKRLIFGGKYDDDSLKIEPTILEVSSMDEKIMQEEIFGPIIPIIIYKNKSEIFEIIDKNKNPLALYLFTDNNSFEKEIIEKVSFGGGCVNDTIIHCTSEGLPFGGIGRSGIGNYHGKASFDAFSHKKSVVKSKKFADISMKYPPFNEKKLELIKKVFNIL
ncbi:aldehyde dehydrogenase family protein [Peptoclostridium sp. AF21-18]|uniref:aldehyde dehydrogenase family protein n=1 Tax=Peptoclostridium sp. AF21-18 TaxID=2292243 RepID=UPI000E5002BC|nr:aldehyde dehydrogenase family protein [Peptoclostridium sp. AF21-18]RHQ99240.1 aldehyde dehydrogenase family protein [Peptoclostridium sp. AF21-18]